MRKYIIDAHNVIYKSPMLKKLADISIDNARSSLLASILSFSKEYPSYKFILVFDGRSNLLSPNPQNIKCVYSIEKTADSMIKDLIKESKSHKLIYVVSSDTEVINYARIYSCRILSSDFFYKEISINSEIKKMPLIKTTAKTEKPGNASRKEVKEMLKLFSEKD